MMCPVCKRDLAPTLSICLTCGAMIHDTVREELETKISRLPEPVTSNRGKLAAPKREAAPAPKKAAPAPQPSPQPSRPPTPAAKPIAPRFETNDLRVKKTSQTLVEFQTKKATIPEWRLQLQNSIRQKAGTNRRAETDSDTTGSKPRTTSGANALKVEFVEEEIPGHQNPRVASALKRIEESRRAFSNQPVPEQSVHVGKSTANRSYPFNVVARSAESAPPATPSNATVNASPKPMLVSPRRIEKKGFDTNKLPPLARQGAVSEKVQRPSVGLLENETRSQPDPRLEVTVAEVENLEIDAVETDDIEDLAPLSMRFSAGLFDFIVGLFATFILLSPFMLSGGNWFSVAGFFAVTASVAIVMFLYLTVTLAFVGRTFGMRLFSLELVDIEENAYPTLHQAAVNSAVYLLSLAFAGIGFLPIIFNEERRGAHDILSGTILIREY